MNMKAIVICWGKKKEENKQVVSILVTFLGMPIKDKEGAREGGKVCSYKGPTLSSSIATIPLVSRNGNVYEYLNNPLGTVSL